jgi:LCP family protein required for cell wall assembly
MKRCLLLSLCAALLVSACDSTPPPPTARVRTPVPTWTLPFPVTGTLPALATPGAEITNISGVELPETPTPDLSATPSPTARPGIDPTLGATTPDPYAAPSTPIPEPMPQLRLDKDIVNILLLGRDTAKDARNYRTDVMIVASINKKANAVTLLTLPRDLYVYVPGWTMTRLNTAAGHGDAIRYPDGGVALLEQTILYNFGIPIHGWARIDFDGFKEVVDILGGVEVPVSCEMADWRMKDPSLDQQNADNWEMFTVTTGVPHMDGDMALWYARSRKHSSDFDRSRRQHQVLRAMFEKGLQLNALTKAPELYDEYVKIVDTDLGLGDILQFVPVAAQLDPSQIKSRFIGRDQVYSWVTPEGAQVLLPDRDAIARVLDEAFQPPAGNVLAREAASVEIWNGTPYGDWTALAADNLDWAGIRPVVGQADATAGAYATTVIYDYTTSAKGSARPELQSLFHVSDENVIAAPDANAAYPFRVILGADYNSCIAPVRVPHGTPTPGAPPPIEGDNIVHSAGVFGPPPRMDGDLSEWTNLAYAIDQPTLGRENWTGPDDLSARWNTAWDEDYLYLALKVKDDVFVQQATGEALSKGDSLELLLDIDPGSRTANTLTERDFQLGISPGNLAQPPAKPEAYLWLPEDEARPVGGVILSARLVPGGYEMEVAIPWATFNLTPFAGEGFAFTLSLNDDDTANAPPVAPGAAQQETQVSSIKDRKLIDPLTWGILALDAPPGP